MTSITVKKMNLEFLQIEKECEAEFEAIAEKLFNNYAIENHDTIYRLTEIEFYWTSPNHPDSSTYQRSHVSPKNGDWFFHYSGVDIALENPKIDGYGGILIRGIYSLKEKKVYKGPLICVMKLFSGTSAFSSSIKTRIIEYRFDKLKPNKSARIGLGKNALVNGTDKLSYRFMINL